MQTEHAICDLVQARREADSSSIGIALGAAIGGDARRWRYRPNTEIAI